MAEISRSGDGVEIQLGRSERRALQGILDRLEPLVRHSRLAQPHAYEDEAEDQEYRRMAAEALQELREADLNRVRQCLTSSARVLLSTEDTVCWLRTLNLLRVALSERLGITTDGWEERFSEEQHRKPPLLTLHTLSWLQEGLLEALDYLPPLAP